MASLKQRLESLEQEKKGERRTYTISGEVIALLNASLGIETKEKPLPVEVGIEEFTCDSTEETLDWLLELFHPSPEEKLEALKVPGGGYGPYHRERYERWRQARLETLHTISDPNVVA